MHISLINNNRTLHIDDTQIDVNDKQILEYTGNYYINTNDIMNMKIIETKFIGIINCHKSYHEIGIYGLYIDPIFIYSNTKNKWLKIKDYRATTYKYFYYPHLLILPETNSNFYPIYSLHTCKNISLNEFNNINESFDLYLEQDL